MSTTRKRNMKQWIREYIENPKKKPMPILSFPGHQLLGCTVEELVKDGHMQALCMKAIADRFQTGAAFSLMDLSVEAEAFGSSVTYSDREVPTVNAPLIRTEGEARDLIVPQVGAGRTDACVEGIREAVGIITDRPVLAGMIGPFSLAGRLTDMTQIMYLCFDEPEMVECLLDKASDFLVQYGMAFKEAGANGVCMAEPAAGLLSPQFFDEFSAPYVKKVIAALEDEDFIVIYHNCGNVRQMIDHLAQIGASGYSLGNTVDLKSMIPRFPQNAAVIGNLDPARVICQGNPDLVREETLKLLTNCGKYKNFIVSSGCDIPPQTPMENIQALFDATEEFYKTNGKITGGM